MEKLTLDQARIRLLRAYEANDKLRNQICKIKNKPSVNPPLRAEPVTLLMAARMMETCRMENDELRTELYTLTQTLDEQSEAQFKANYKHIVG